METSNRNAIQNVVVIGAGLMGHGLAQYFAQRGIRVTLVDLSDDFLQKARDQIKANLEFMVELGEIDPGRIESVMARIRYTTDIKEAAALADFVIEAVSENLAIKKNIFQQLGECTQQETILASNTSSFDINEFSSITPFPGRVLGTHFFVPPQITPCVEVIPAKETSQENLDLVFVFLEAVGKVPTQCKSAPGFVGNRIQYALVAEALAIVEEGLATPEEVDRIVKTSFGFRLSAYGPFEVCDQAGIDIYAAVFDYLYENLGREHFKPPKIFRELAKQGKLGLKTGEGFYQYSPDAAEEIKRERDRRLYNRLRILKNETKCSSVNPE